MTKISFETIVVYCLGAQLVYGFISQRWRHFRAIYLELIFKNIILVCNKYCGHLYFNLKIMKLYLLTNPNLW